MATSVTSKEPDGADQALTQVISTTQKGRASLVKNKLRRQLLYRKERLRKARERRDRKEKRKREAEQLGEEVQIAMGKLRSLHNNDVQFDFFTNL